MQPWLTVIVDGRSQHFEQLKLLKSYRQNCLHLTSAWRQQQIPSLIEKNCGTTDSNFHEQRKQSLQQQLCYLIIINAYILKQNTNTARLCRFVFKGFKRLAFRMNWTFNSWVFLYDSNIFVWYTVSQWFFLLALIAESFCLCIFCLLLLLGVVVVDMLLAAPSSYLK